jgi:hypothetical protein
MCFYIHSISYYYIQLTLKFKRFNFEPFPNIDLNVVHDKSYLESHKPTLEKYFEALSKNVEIINDMKFRELFRLNESAPVLALSYGTQALLESLKKMCSHIESCENTMITMFTNQINDVRSHIINFVTSIQKKNKCAPKII